MKGVHQEALMAAGYALFLLAAAFCLERLARHSHLRSERYRTGGFTFHAHLDAWLCPEGEHLRRHETDHARRLVRYRARPRICNACPRKELCTDSDEGREVARPLDPWPHSEAGRFHRGVCLVLLGVAALVLVVEAVRHHEPMELLLMAGAGTIVALVAQRMVPGFRQTQANFPLGYDASPVGGRSGRST
jgi:hypothetical protein